MMRIFNFQFSIFNSKRREQGFTLIELLIVIAIIGILSSILLANYVGVRQRAKDGVRKSDLRQMQTAFELYRADNGAYPNFDISCNCKCGWAFTAGPEVFYAQGSIPTGVTVYLQKIPCDPNSTITTPINYTYFPDSTGGTYKLITCLENGNDSQKDSVADSNCTTANVTGNTKTGNSYTVLSP